MEKNTKKILVFGLLGLFALIFVMQFVAAQTPLDPIKDWFGNWREGNLSPNIAKYLFWVLVSIVVYSIGSKIPGLKTIFEGSLVLVGAVFSILVGFLSMAYITPDEVYALMTAYSAMGFVFGGMLPFIILFYFTITLATSSENKSASERFFTKLLAVALWILFTGFLIYKSVVIPEGVESDAAYRWLTIILAIISIIGIFSMGLIFKKVRDWLRVEKKGKSGEVVEDATTNIKQQANMQDNLGETKSP